VVLWLTVCGAEASFCFSCRHGGARKCILPSFAAAEMAEACMKELWSLVRIHLYYQIASCNG